MKKIFLFAAAAALLTACSSEDLAGVDNVQQKAEGDAINFSVYTQRSVTRAGKAGTDYSEYTKGLQTADLQKIGFGILAYYTDDEKFDADKSTPSFMYNTQVTYNTTSNKWEYNPVMYWPNEFKKANAENIDRVSFFAYAPYVEVDNTTGIPYADQLNWKTDKKLVDTNEKNITAISKNTATGNPYVKYVVDTNPLSSVDLLWGVASSTAATRYKDIDKDNSKVTVTEGLPFIDLVKPNEPRWADSNGDPVDGGVLNFNMLHALSKLNIDVKYVADAETPDADGSKSQVIKANETRIYIRSITIGGFTMKAALDLNNKVANKPLWKDYDGKNALVTPDNTKFFDGRKDGREGTETGEDLNESYTGLNPLLLENYVNDVWGGTADWTKKNAGVTKDVQNLFGDGTAPIDRPIYVIPAEKPIDITIEYDVLTADPNLSDFLSDATTHGSMIKNIITKESKAIFGSDTSMEAGKAYTIHLILGMTSVKIEATVTDFGPETGIANLPQNQD